MEFDNLKEYYLVEYKVKKSAQRFQKITTGNLDNAIHYAIGKIQENIGHGEMHDIRIVTERCQPNSLVIKADKKQLYDIYSKYKAFLQTQILKILPLSDKEKIIEVSTMQLFPTELKRGEKFLINNKKLLLKEGDRFILSYGDRKYQSAIIGKNDSKLKIEIITEIRKG